MSVAVRIRTLSFVIGLAALSGCASTPVSPLPRTVAENRGEVVVFRESAFIAGGVSLTVGAGTDAFANLSNSQRVSALLPAREHEIFVQARSAEPTRVRVKVTQGGRVCLRTSSDSGSAAKALIPILLIASGYHFYLDEVPCPTPEELAKYELVPVTYQ